MFGSNNYLGLTTHPHLIEAVKRAVDEFGVGMGGPPLLNGMSSLHRKLEARIAQFKGSEDALLFASGFQAQLGWVNGLLRDDDVLICDELVHASLYDAIKLVSVGTRVRAFTFKHNNCEDLEKRLVKCQQLETANRLIYVAVEGVYSMDGDLAPLPAIRELCDRYGAILVVDDAHGTGVMGKKGTGTDEHFGLKGRIDVTMGTFSKALGVTGGFITASREVIEYLRFFARSYMFSASLSTPVVAAILAGFDIIEQEPERISQLRANSNYLLQQLQASGFQASSDSAIIPVRIPAEIAIRTLAWRFHQEGIFVNSVEYPAVPLNAQRLRISVMATHTREDLDTFIHVCKNLDREFSIVR
jgi:8-amino-7-oxononanoate synthase